MLDLFISESLANSVRKGYGNTHQRMSAGRLQSRIERDSLEPGLTAMVRQFRIAIMTFIDMNAQRTVFLSYVGPLKSRHSGTLDLVTLRGGIKKTIDKCHSTVIATS